MFLNFGAVSKTSTNRGDWLTENVELTAKGGRDDRNYLWVSLKMRSETPFLSLVLPSILIIVADVVSFALPLGGGERISFKVTLVLSFIMFLIILKDLLPGGGQKAILFLFGHPGVEHVAVYESRPDITVIKLKASEEEKNSPLQKVVKFLNKMAAQDQKRVRHHRFANKVDLICFCIYLTILIVYTVAILYFSFGSRCEINQLEFWP
ncbi:unnamed protein product [Coregonus sp. 'balchen']|nr:unnamed protein product [Coregonus sp. 'balchen']